MTQLNVGSPTQNLAKKFGEGDLFKKFVDIKLTWDPAGFGDDVQHCRNCTHPTLRRFWMILVKLPWSQKQHTIGNNLVNDLFTFSEGWCALRNHVTFRLIVPPSHMMVTHNEPTNKQTNHRSPGIIRNYSRAWLLLDLSPAQWGPMMTMLTRVFACELRCF